MLIAFFSFSQRLALSSSFSSFSSLTVCKYPYLVSTESQTPLENIDLVLKSFNCFRGGVLWDGLEGRKIRQEIIHIAYYLKNLASACMLCVESSSRLSSSVVII